MAQMGTFLCVLSAAAVVVLCIAPVSNAQAALLSVKRNLREPYLGILNSWKGINCFRNWYGVSCDPETHCIADTNLRGEKANRTGFMSGTISPEICLPSHQALKPHNRRLEEHHGNYTPLMTRLDSTYASLVESFALA